MFRLLCVTVALLHIAVGFDITRSKDIQQVHFTEQDIVPKDLARSRGLERSSQFFGDFQIGRRRTEEELYANTLEINNQADFDLNNILIVHVGEGATMHYIRVLNLPYSYVLIRGDQNVLGAPSARLNIRVPARSNSKIQIIVAAN